MFQIDDDMTIYITRGDTAYFTVTADDNGKAYKFQPGDVVRMKVTAKKDCTNVAFQKDFPVLEECEKVDILLTEEETKIGDVISKPVDYWYEIELNPYSNPQTIIGYDDDGAKIFKLFPEGKDLGSAVVNEEDVPVVDGALSLTSTRPVANQAITKAMTELSKEVKKAVEYNSESVLKMENKVNKSVNKASKDIQRLDSEIAVERARINQVTTLENGSTTGDAELADARIDKDGKTHANVGEHIRTVASQLSSEITDLQSEKRFNRDCDQKDVNGRVIFLTEREPHIVTDLSGGMATLHGVNFFNLDQASFATNSYSASHTLTKENGGIKVVCTVKEPSAYLTETTTFIAPFTGLLYCSCEADCEGDIKDVAFLVKVNGENHTMCYGKGLLYQAVEVTEGDTVDLRFYTHMGTNDGNTLYYKNIQCAYGGLYEYKPFKSPITNAFKKTLVLPTDNIMANWAAADTVPATGGLYRYNLNTEIGDMAEYPPNNDTVPNNVIVNGANLITYNQSYNGVEGVGISTTGKVSLFIKSVQSHTALLEYLENNAVSISYVQKGSTEYTNLNNEDICQGAVLEFETEQDVSYYHLPAIEKKYTCVCFGDSITGMFANKTDYPSMMERDTDLSCFNVGFSGSQLTDHSDANYRPFSFNRLVDAIVSADFTSQEATAGTCGGLYTAHLTTLKSIDFSKVDFVTVFFGTNDWGSNVTLKSEHDKTEIDKQRTNVEDALVYSIKTLLSAYPHLRFIVITPYWRSVSNGKDSDINSNTNGDYLSEFADYIQEVVEKFLHLPCINLYKTSGANALTNRYYTSDGTHPTEMMKRIISKKIFKALEEIK